MPARLKLIFMAVALTLTLSGAARAEGFQSAAPQALLVDYESGATLYEKNADAQFPPRALVKLMTAELVFRELKEGRLHLDDTFHVSEHAWRTGGAHAHATATLPRRELQCADRGPAARPHRPVRQRRGDRPRRGHGGQRGGFRRPDEQARRRTRPRPFQLRRPVGARRSRARTSPRATWRGSPPTSSANTPTTTTISARRSSPGTRSAS